MNRTSAVRTSPGRTARIAAFLRQRGWVLLLALLMTPVLAQGLNCGRMTRDDALLSLTTLDGDPPQVVAFQEAARGETVAFTLRLGRPSGSLPVEYDVTDAPDDHPLCDAPLPPAVSSVSAVLRESDPNVLDLTMTLRPDAPLVPLYVRSGAGEEENGHLNYNYGIRAVRVHAGAGAPVVAGCIPSLGLRGTSVDVEIPAGGIVGNVLLDPADASFTVSGTVWDAVGGRIRATLRIADDARTGRTSFEVVNGDGVRSEPVDFTVLAGEPAPTVTGLYPNVLRIGLPVPTVLVAGSEFTTGLVVTSSDSAQAAPGTATLIDSRTFSLPWTLGAAAAPANVDVTVETVGGVTSPALLVVAPRDATVPVLTRIVPDRVVTNTSTLVRIDSAALLQRGPYEVVAIGSEAVPLPFAEATIVPGSVARDDYVIVRLVGAPGDPAVFGTPTGTVHLALRNADGLTSRAVPVRIDPRPAAPNPVIKSVTVGKVGRGGEVVETIRGERLFEVERVYVESGGVELKHNARIETQPDSQSITVTLAATADAPLTGDVATNLVVVTRRGQSNRLAYRVEAASSGDCGVTATSGVRLVATGASGYRAEIITADSAIDRITGSGITLIDHCTPGLNCVGMYLLIDAADLHVGSYTAITIQFADGSGSLWYRASAPFQVVAEGAGYVVLCIDSELGSTGAGEDVRLTGYLVLLR